MPQAAESPPRFVALDSLRGVCACMVVLYHFRTTGPITGSELSRNGWLFVDFFFVLSGFVIAAGYGRRLAEGFPIRWFMLLRLGRVYPLYAVMLFAFFATEMIGVLVAAGGMSTRAAFAPPYTLGALLQNVALVQVFGLRDTLSWNPPGWSIAAEVWAYLLAALLLRHANRWRVPVLIVAIMGAVLTLGLVGDDYLDRTFAFGLVRCIYGFGLGMLCWEIHRASGARIHAPYKGATLVEIAMVLAIGALVFFAGSGPLTLACPPLFMLAVLVFAREGGVVSRALRWRPLVLLGTLSYSIYMVHHFLQAHLKGLLTLIGKLSGTVIVSKVRSSGGGATAVIGGPAPDLTAFAMLAVVIGVAWVSWRWIEEPMRRWSRGYAARRGALGAERIAPAL